MSLEKRQINVILTNNDDSGNAETLTLEGYRVHAVMTNNGGYNMSSILELRIWGMPLSDMNKYTTVGSALVASDMFNIVVNAGDVGGVVSQVFSGNITNAYIDFSAIPEVSFNVSAVTGLNFKLKAAPSNSWKGSVDVASAISTLAQSMGFAFINNGVNVQLQNQVVSGSLVDQIQALAAHAAIPVCIENDKVMIWPNDGALDDIVVDVNPENGLVGFPSYTDTGFSIKTLFNPNIFIGRQVNLKSTLPQANGIFKCIYVTHELSTYMPNGAWFTSCQLPAGQYLGQNIYVGRN